MVFPLLSLNSNTWGAEAAHPPEIPLLVNMPEMERPGMRPSVGTEEGAGEGEGPGPLVSYLVTKMGHRLPVPVTVVPGGMTLERIEAIC